MTKEQVAPGMTVETDADGLSMVAEGVYLGDGLEELYDKPVNTIRLRKEDPPEDWPAEDMYMAVAEVKFIHTCGGVNWIMLGVDPGESRCVKCTEWL